MYLNYLISSCFTKLEYQIFTRQALDDLLEYLDNNLLTMNNNLLKANFDRILESIWVEVIEEFKTTLETEEMVCILGHNSIAIYVTMNSYS